MNIRKSHLLLDMELYCTCQDISTSKDLEQFICILET